MLWESLKQKGTMSQSQCLKAGPWALEVKSTSHQLQGEWPPRAKRSMLVSDYCKLDVRHYLDLGNVRLSLKLIFVQPQFISTEVFGFRLLRRALIPKQTCSSLLWGLHPATVTSSSGLISAMIPLLCVCMLSGELEFFMFSMFHASLGGKISDCWWFAFLLRFWWGNRSGRQWAPNTRDRSDWAKSGIGSGTRSSSRS